MSPSAPRPAIAMVEGSGATIVAEVVFTSLPVKLLKPNEPSPGFVGTRPDRLNDIFSGWVIGPPRKAVIVAEPVRLAAPPDTSKVEFEKVTVRKAAPLATPPTVPPVSLKIV